jgi:hypothetical protein
MQTKSNVETVKGFSEQWKNLTNLNLTKRDFIFLHFRFRVSAKRVFIRCETMHLTVL